MESSQTTSPALTALLSNLVDYAGLFPPASLDMAATVANYETFVDGDDAWMLERLIVPVGRLEEFEQSAAGRLPETDEGEPWPISALTAVDRLAEDLGKIAAFNELHAEPAAGRAVIDTLELKAGTADAIDRALDVIPEEVFPFFEIPVGDDPRGLIAALVGGDAGAKIRTGGVTADLYPPVGAVAAFIAGCATADVPFKATAGLHHPLRGRNEAVGVMELGFLNVFVAAALALHQDLQPPEIVTVLEESSIDAFHFDERGLRWRDRQLTVEEVDDSRLTFAVSFGSCSFDEPRADLRALGLL
ncbi:MAG: hypothetical protein GY715_10625 [Planctomycetes bacterium]|nr:hypothetical protein [Planctomycetota bacterium]